MSALHTYTLVIHEVVKVKLHANIDLYIIVLFIGIYKLSICDAVK